MRVGSYQLAFVVKMETLSDWRLTTTSQITNDVITGDYFVLLIIQIYIPISVCLLSYILR